MSIFFKEQLRLINRQIKDDAEAYIHRLPLEISSLDICQLWVRPEHRDTLSEAYKIVTDTSRTYRTRVKTGDKTVAHATYQGFLPPNYITQVQPDKDAPAYEALSDWAQEIQGTITEFLNLQFCITYLHNCCVDPRQLSFFLPSLSYLLREEEDPKRYYNNRYQYTDKLIFSDFKAKRRVILSKRNPLKIPPIPTQVKDACKQADALMLRMIMAENNNSPRTERVGLISELSSVPVPTPWKDIFGTSPDAVISIDGTVAEHFNYIPEVKSEEVEEEIA